MMKGLISKILTINLFIILILVSSSCNINNQANSSSEIRMGYLLNITHAVPMVLLEESNFKDRIKPYHFSAGGYLLNNLLTKNLDLAFIGPGPYLTAIDKGFKLKLLGAYAYGANVFVLSKDVLNQSKDQIKDLKIAIPQFGNTQDLLAKLYLKDLAQDFYAISPAELEFAFHNKSIDATLVTEPWGSMLLSKGYVDGAKIFPNKLKQINQYPTTLLVVREDYYEANKELVDEFTKESINVLRKFSVSKNHKNLAPLIQKHFKEKVKKDIPLESIEANLKTIVFDENNNLDFFLKQLEQAAYKAHYLK